ncbi:MFS transporter [Streptomyces sp. NBC_00853]|uniref:MFS transporter n=1 Tax=Streptomyces sp. NBC_00853 TaxID=2903681 RepID=UPI003872E0C3|nr:MFS transporter [Streptomyces sp. NBC_00853]
MPLETLRTVAGLAPPLRTLFLTTLLFRTGTTAYPFLTPHLLGGGGLDAAGAGLVVTAFGIGALAADLAAGRLLGRLHPYELMRGGFLLGAAAVAVVPLLHGLPALVAGVLVWGFAYEIVTPAAYAATIAGSRPEQRKVAFSCYRLAINLGLSAGPLVGALLYALDPYSVFWANALCVLAAAAFLHLRRAHRPGAGRYTDTDTGGGDGGGGTGNGAAPHGARRPTAAERTRFWTVFGLSLPIQLAYALPSVFVGAYVIVGLGLPGYWAGVVFTVNAVGIVLFEVPLNIRTARVGHLATLLIGYALAGAGFLLMALADTGPELVLATLVWTAGEIVVFPGLLDYVSRLSGPAADRTMGLYSSGVNLAFIAAPQLALHLSAPDHPGAPWAAAGAAVCAAGLLLLAARTHPYTWHKEEPCTSAP